MERDCYYFCMWTRITIFVCTASNIILVFINELRLIRNPHLVSNLQTCLLWKQWWCAIRKLPKCNYINYNNILIIIKRVLISKTYGKYHKLFLLFYLIIHASELVILYLSFEFIFVFLCILEKNAVLKKMLNWCLDKLIYCVNFNQSQIRILWKMNRSNTDCWRLGFPANFTYNYLNISINFFWCSIKDILKT